jgi:acyl-CoA thioester hydrolase
MSENIQAPLIFPVVQVAPEWIDYNGHMNVAYYVLVFDKGVDGLLAHIGLDVGHVEKNKTSSFTLEAHINYLQEVSGGEPLRVTCQLLDYDYKRIHYFLHMYHANEHYLAATSEQLSMHIDMNIRRSSPYPDHVMTRIEALMRAHKDLPVPEQVGSVMKIRHKENP